MFNCWNDVSVWEYVLISIFQLLKWCQCLRWYVPCILYIVQLLKWCQCLRICAQFLLFMLLKWCQCLSWYAGCILSICWNDVSVWEYCAQFLLSNNWNNVSVWDDMLDEYCLTVKMMSVFENMCSISIV